MPALHMRVVRRRTKPTRSKQSCESQRLCVCASEGKQTCEGEELEHVDRQESNAANDVEDRRDFKAQRPVVIVWKEAQRSQDESDAAFQGVGSVARLTRCRPTKQTKHHTDPVMKPNACTNFHAVFCDMSSGVGGVAKRGLVSILCVFVWITKLLSIRFFCVALCLLLTEFKSKDKRSIGIEQREN